MTTWTVTRRDGAVTTIAAGTIVVGGGALVAYSTEGKVLLALAPGMWHQCHPVDGAPTWDHPPPPPDRVLEQAEDIPDPFGRRDAIEARSPSSTADTHERPVGGVPLGPTWALVHIDPSTLTSSYSFHPSQADASAASTHSRDLIIDLTRFRRDRDDHEEEDDE